MESRGMRVRRSSALLALGVIYLALVATTFIYKVDLAADRTFQYLLHVSTIATAIVYIFFAEIIYREEGSPSTRMALIFAALFAVPVILGRGIGIYAILALPDSIFNFYADVSVSKTIEVVSWTTLFPISMLSLAGVFFKKRERLLSALCVLSALCCFVAFLSLIFPEAVFTLVGMMGWGVLFVLIVLVYLVKAVRESEAA